MDGPQASPDIQQKTRDQSLKYVYEIAKRFYNKENLWKGIEIAASNAKFIWVNY